MSLLRLSNNLKYCRILTKKKKSREPLCYSVIYALDRLWIFVYLLSEFEIFRALQQTESPLELEFANLAQLYFLTSPGI